MSIPAGTHGLQVSSSKSATRPTRKDGPGSLVRSQSEAWRRRDPRRLGPCLRLAALALAFASWHVTAFGQTPEPESADALTVLVYNHVGVPPATLAAAQRHADQVFGAAGAKINWIACPNDGGPNGPDLCRSGWSMQTPGLRLIAGENKFQSAQLGYTDIPVLSTVYYQAIVARARRDNLDSSVSVLLGCIIAHELGHLLLRSPKHDPRGIMQANWGTSQLRQALTGHLLFTKDQAVRILSQARMLASLQDGKSTRNVIQ